MDTLFFWRVQTDTIHMGRARFRLSICFSVTLLVSACMGVNNRNGAVPYFESELSTSGFVSNCHFTNFESAVANRIQSNCVSCHANPGNGNLILKSGTTADVKEFNYMAVLDFIEAGNTNPSSTSLLQRIVNGTSYSHPYKQPNGSAVVNDFYDFVDLYLNDSECAGSSTEDPGGFF